MISSVCPNVRMLTMNRAAPSARRNAISRVFEEIMDQSRDFPQVVGERGEMWIDRQQGRPRAELPDKDGQPVDVRPCKVSARNCRKALLSSGGRPDAVLDGRK